MNGLNCLLLNWIEGYVRDWGHTLLLLYETDCTWRVHCTKFSQNSINQNALKSDARELHWNVCEKCGNSINYVSIPFNPSVDFIRRHLALWNFSIWFIRHCTSLCWNCIISCRKLISNCCASVLLSVSIYRFVKAKNHRWVIIQRCNVGNET